ncbi:MAG: VWA domain-containing protein, partial [Gemmataceae bacterium]|nr:VWA domain-containing protein [Gemmataceae bacterium]
MAFAHPAALLLLAVAPLIMWSGGRWPRVTLRRAGLDELDVVADRWTGRILTGLWLAALLAGAVALAGPDLPWPTTRPGIGLVLVADVSGSMAESDGGPTRIETLKRTFDELIARRPGDRIGLVLFAAHPDTACP